MQSPGHQFWSLLSIYIVRGPLCLAWSAIEAYVVATVAAAATAAANSTAVTAEMWREQQQRQQQYGIEKEIVLKLL